MPGPSPTDFSSQEYWSKRFIDETKFEWLSPVESLLPTIVKQVHILSTRPSISSISSSSFDTHQDGNKALKILHFGSGTSTLGIEASKYLLSLGFKVEVVDGDYVAEDIHSPVESVSGEDIEDHQHRRPIPLIQLDVMDPISLQKTTPKGGWDLLMDKSTADAISCGPDVELCIEAADGGDKAGSVKRKVEPIISLCERLANVTKQGGRWICISYSERRFDHLLDSYTLEQSTESSTKIRRSWTLISKDKVLGGFGSEGKVVDDGNGGTRMVYQPDTGIWVYILERL